MTRLRNHDNGFPFCLKIRIGSIHVRRLSACPQSNVSETAIADLHAGSLENLTIPGVQFLVTEGDIRMPHVFGAGLQESEKLYNAPLVFSFSKVICGGRHVFCCFATTSS